MPSSFWTKVTGTQPSQPPQSPASPAGPRAWWQDTPRQPSPEPVAGGVSLAGQGVTTEQIARVAISEGHDLSKAQHMRNESDCPSCGSGDYLSPPGGGRSRCFDCGYPIVQRGSGLNITQSASKGTPARQTGDGGGVIHNYHPQSISDRIG